MGWACRHQASEAQRQVRVLGRRQGWAETGALFSELTLWRVGLAAVWDQMALRR